MKSKGLFGRKLLDVQERQAEIGTPDEDHVIVEVKACGVCGTDVNFVRDWEGDPLPLGHEISAEVVEVGKNVANLRAGDRVIVEDVTMCGVCPACKTGQPQFCRNLYNMEGQPGMGQYLSVRYNCLDKFEGMDFVSACLTEPLAVALTAVLNAEIPLGGSVMVLGSGPQGLMAARLAKLRGASFVGLTGSASDSPLQKARLALAEHFGCDLVVRAGQDDVAGEVKSRFPDGVDRVIATAPPESLYDAFKVIRFGGLITFMGLHLGGKNMIQIDVNDLIFRKITLRPTFAEPAINFPVTNRLLRDGLVDARSLITHTFGFAEAKGMFGAIIAGTEPVVKAVMLPND
jgi:L-iditol 2-dehydrogenase